MSSTFASATVAVLLALMLWLLGLPMLAGIVLVLAGPRAWFDASPTAPGNSSAATAAAPMVAVVGNIGAGKSRIIRACNLGTWQQVLEPIEDWAPELTDGSDAASATLQVMAMEHYVQVNDRVTSGATHKLMVERDYLSTALFCGNAHPRIGAALATLVGVHPIRLPTVVLHADADVPACLQAVATRMQPGDAHISAKWLSALHDRHELLLQVYADAGVTVIRRSDYDTDEDAANAAATAAEARCVVADAQQQQFVTPDMVKAVTA